MLCLQGFLKFVTYLHFKISENCDLSFKISKVCDLTSKVSETHLHDEYKKPNLKFRGRTNGGNVHVKELSQNGKIIPYTFYNKCTTLALPQMSNTIQIEKRKKNLAS